jgi:RNA polymerase sigma-70 factor (ECF subfamily)
MGRRGEAARRLSVDASEFDRLVRDQLKPALRFATRLCGDAAAEEVVQEALFRTARAWQSFRGESSLRTWFFRIVVNTARDHLRAHRPQNELVDEPVDERSADPPQQMLDRETGELVAREVERLPQRQREVLVLIAYENHRISEAAAVLELSEQNVRTNLHLARQKLRPRLSKHLPEYWSNDGR